MYVYIYIYIYIYIYKFKTFCKLIFWAKFDLIFNE